MAKKQFKTESKKLLDMMVNSIYTNKEIFLRELISNASDALDKLHFRSLTDGKGVSRETLRITVTADKRAGTLTISDNGCGMTKDELENNLGVIAKSGSYDFKNDPENISDGIDIIGQFGVGFYSAFMVADKISVISRAYGEETAHLWESSGADGYTVTEAERDTVGSTVILRLKADTEDEKYSDFLNEYTLRRLIKKYSDYIRYPIVMTVEKTVPKEGTEGEYDTVTEDETLNSMIPIWKKGKDQVTDEEYAEFYKEKYFDFAPPVKTIKQKAEGGINFEALLFIPSRAPYDYYSREFEKGLQLYSSGVMIMEKCKELLPDYFSFVRGVVDSSDLSLNISREMLQQDRQLKAIAKSVEKKIISELKKLLENEREAYEKFYSAFGAQLKWGVYSDYGMHKETLKDLIMFKSSDGKTITLKEYVDGMAEGREKILYASGESVEQISRLPRVESAVSSGYTVLYLTDEVDEFALRVLENYDGKAFSDLLRDDLDLVSDEEKEKTDKENEASKDMLDFIKESLSDVKSVRLSSALSNHPVGLSSDGEISIAMEKTLNRMPGAEGNTVKAELVFEINGGHPVYGKMKELFASDKEALGKLCRVLYSGARLASGLSVEDSAELNDLICGLII